MAQVEHNFKKDPEKTNCHILKPPFDSNELGIELVEASTFRFVQKISISKYRIPNTVHFYSCDGKSGYIIAEESKDIKVLYTNVPKSTWDEFMNTDDPIGFYKNKIRPLKEKD